MTRNFVSGIAALILVCAASGAWAAEPPQAPGRYQGVQASDSAVWVVDTQTGRVAKCTQEFADAAPRCTAFSK
jgi:hypothetical protein